LLVGTSATGAGVCLLGKGSEHEFAFGDADVRDLEAFMVESGIVVEKYIEIDVARAFVNDLLAAQ
jgi:hypothetical protein